MVQIYLNNDYFDSDQFYHTDFYIEHKEMNLHSHEFWEISYVYEGRGKHYFEKGSAVPIREGEFVFISPGAKHCITSPPESWVRVCNFLMKPEYMDKLKNRFIAMHEFDEYSLRNMICTSKPFCIHLKDDSGSVNNLLMSAAHEYKHFTHGSDFIIESAALSLMIYITRLYERLLTNEKVTSTKNEVIDDLIKYIKSNFGSNITLDYLAAYAHLSPEYLSRYFKKCTGKNISDYLSEIRIERAKYRLRTSNYSISDISMYCGYRSISNFQKSFKKAVGMSAGEYRKSCV